MSDAIHQTVLLADYQPPPFWIDRAMLRVELDDARTLVRSRLALRRNPALPGGDGALRLDGEDLELLAIRLDGQPLGPDRYQQDGRGLILDRVPDQFHLETLVAIHPDRNTALEGLFRSGPMLCTQCEPEGFRRLSFFIDRPDVMTRFRVTLVGDQTRYPVLLANGNPLGTRRLTDGRHLARWDDPFPKPAYLFALVGGQLERIRDRFQTQSGRSLDLNIYVEAQNRDQCGHAMASLQRAMAWDQEKYGREYDLDVYNVVAVGDFNMGAMENKGLNIFNSRYVLALPDIATDQDFQGIESVIGHEYFHNWSGNRVTCRDWFQLSLKEGFTVFRDQQFSGDMGSPGVKRIADVRALRARQFAEDAGPMAHPVRPASYIEINNFYTATVYEKGAEVVRMLATLLGPELFRRGTDLYFSRHDGQAVTTDDFLACMAEVSGRDLSQFQRWYDQAGTPELTLSGAYDETNACYRLRVRQSCPATPGQPHKEPFHIPLALGLLGPAGEEWQLRLAGEQRSTPGTRILEVLETDQEFSFVDIPAPPVPSLCRGFSAPVKVRYPYSDDELLHLIAHDTDNFNRWDAAQRLTERIILDNLGPRSGAPRIPAGLEDAFAAALADPRADPALMAEVLALPSEAFLGDQMDRVDVDGIHQVREELLGHLARTLGEAFRQTYQATSDPGPYQLDPTSIGRRALKNRCLEYLAHCAGGLDLCWEQFEAGHNMTDVLAALQLLAHSLAPYRDQALERFYHRWQDNPLVVDKWLTVQALSKRPDTLEQVQALLGHSCFAAPNPNRIRALIGSFSTANPARFHRLDGAGHRLLADRVLALDPRNPQVAARLLRGLARWRAYDGPRQQAMHDQLERILTTPNLSKDTYEIALKSLAAPAG